MYMAELAYQASPRRETLKRWDAIVSAAADYMASYAWKNASSGRYDLGPPSYGVTENTPPAETLNLAYEVSGAPTNSYGIVYNAAHIYYLDCILEIWTRCCARMEEKTRQTHS